MKTDPENRITLAIESAILGGSLSIVQGSRIIAGYAGDKNGVSRAEDLLPNLDRLISSSIRDKSKISRVAVSVGPGSFTGLRIGIATAMGLKRSLGIECVGIPLLEAMAEMAVSGSVIAAVPVGKADVCFQRFVSDRPIAEPMSVSVHEFLTHLDTDMDAKLVVPNGLAGIVGTLLEDQKIVDAGTNLASIIGLASADRAYNDSLDPIYVQSPRFS